MAGEQTLLHAWLSKPRATVRIDTTVRWGQWMQALRRQFAGRRREPHERMQILDRLSLGGKKALLLVSIEGQRFLVGLGDEATPSVSALHRSRTTSASMRSRQSQMLGKRKRVR